MHLSERDAQRLRRVAALADTRGLLHPVQQALVHRRGWLAMLAPRACGGAELPLPAAVRLEEAIARADGSTGWVVTLCAGAGWFAGFLPPALAREIIGTPRLCIAGSGAPSGVAEPDGDGFRIRGEWAHASGATMATHFTFNAVVREAGVQAVRAFVVPAAQVQVLPTWRGMGLRATASHAFRIDDVRVPRTHGFEIAAAAATSDGPLYRFPFLPLAVVTLAANVGGMARHFIELAQPAIHERKRLVGGVERASEELDAVRTRFYERLDHAWAQVEARVDPSSDEMNALQQAAWAWVSAARSGVDTLYPYCGLHAADSGTELNRMWRDFHTATQHALCIP